MREKFFNPHWWKNSVKYQPLAQRLFLLLNLSTKSPATLNIEPTNNCNLACSFCPTRKTDRPFGFMTNNFYQQIINEIAEKKRLSVLWLNKDGEPLLHPHLPAMIAYAKKKNVAGRVEVYTNGLLLNGNLIREIILSGLDSLVISVDSTDAKNYQQLKKSDNYEQLVDNIKKFLLIREKLGKSQPLLSVKMINFGNLDDIKTFQKQWGNLADSVIIQPLHNWEGSMKLETGNWKLETEKRYTCNLPWLAPAITWDGLTVPCCVNYRQNELVMGDLRKQSLGEIWRGGKFRALRLAHLKQNFNKYPTCLYCRFWRQLPNMEFYLRRLGV